MKKVKLISLLFAVTLSAAAQLPVISVRFANPTYHCENQTYSLDVEFKSNMAGKQIYGMNVRFFYDDDILEYLNMEGFAQGYSAVSPSPALVKTDQNNHAAARFGFPAGHPLEYVNGAIQMTGTSTITLTPNNWTKLFSVLFHVDDAASLNIPSFNPSVIWDLEPNSIHGGWLNGDDGVVVSLAAPSPAFSSPATEVTEQFNWVYNATTGVLPYGTPAALNPVATTGNGSVTVSIAASSTTVNAGDTVTFTATPVNGGTAPVYKWMINGQNTGITSQEFRYVPVNDDAVSCILISNESCVTGNPATSNTIIMEVSGVSQIVNVGGVGITDGMTECYNATKILTIAGNGTTFAVYNGGHAIMIAGEKIIYKPGTTVDAGGYMHGYITTNNQYCGTQHPTLPSVIAGTSPQTPAGQVDFTVYPNPTNGNFVVAQTNDKQYNSVIIKIFDLQGQEKTKAEMKFEKVHGFNLSGLPQGLYFIKIDADGHVEEMKLVIMK